jgi:hypothetical protein
MPPYNGYRDVADYVARRLRETGQRAIHVSSRIGKSRTYVYYLMHGRLPSPGMCPAVARELGDDPQTLRILCGYETPPADAETVTLARQILALPDPDRAALQRIVAALHDNKTEPIGPVRRAGRRK